MASIMIFLSPVLIHVFRKYRINILFKNFNMTIPQIVGTSIVMSLILFITAKQYVSQIERTLDKIRASEVTISLRAPPIISGVEFIIFMVGMVTIMLTIITIPLYFSGKIKIEPKQQHSLDNKN
ncbi:hypothetical protein LCGC14_0303470 [marine sediment metagenome]|uniref:Uncharacterized protein n=1 Tax=marine sediment metagenome TaxID=412755 RepID=A0A0F9WBC3_9ZZZZ